MPVSYKLNIDMKRISSFDSVEFIIRNHIVRDYLIKVSTPSNRRGVLVGARGLVRLTSPDFAVTSSVSASQSTKDVFTIRYRGTGIKVSFYYK